MSVISRLNSSKQVATGLVRALNAENKVWLMFVQGKNLQKMCGRLIQRLRTNKQVIADLFTNKLQKKVWLLILDLKMQKLTSNGYF